MNKTINNKLMVRITTYTKTASRILACPLLAAVLLLTNPASATEQLPDAKPILRITTQPFEKTARNHEVYFYKALELALTKTRDSDGPFELNSLQGILSNKRYIAEVRREGGLVDVIWTMNDAERERDLLPIKISLLRGMNSYRIFLIREADQQKFSAIDSLDDLKQLKAGSGATWPDTPILKANGLTVVTSGQYENLFDMLVHKRFDYFPRGVYEIWNEHSIHGHRGLAIENQLMFHYPAPIYFFVNKKNQALANRIQRGLEIAIADGSFDKLFFSTPGFARGFKEMNNHSRTVFHLETPFPMED